jgi:phosphonate transport system permease protein
MIGQEKKASRVPAPLAGFCSLVPGIGQIVIGRIQRGFILLASFASILGLLAWRIDLLAHREPTLWDKLAKAAGRRPFFIGLILGLLVVIWLWNIWDAYRQAARREKGSPGIFILIVVALFALGWQISQIDLYKAVSELPDAWPPLSRVLWPWEAAITYRTDETTARAPVLIGCEGEIPPLPEEEEGEPYVYTEPRCGELSDLDENNEIIPGTEITVYGEGFKPDSRTEIWWRDSIGNEFRPRYKGEYAAVTTDDEGSFEYTMIMPYRLIPPSSRGPQIHHVVAKQVFQTGGPIPADPLLLTIERMVETIVMGMMATIFGIFFSIPVSFLAARNLMSGSWITMAIYYVTRAILNIIRSIEPLIWALIAVVWVGLGPFAGIIALTIHSIAALGKLYSEAIENIDNGPIEAIQATGANKLQTIVFAVIPQMIPPFVSFSIYRWDINVRMSTIIGLVGGGGIGFLLVQYIRLLDYKAAGIAVWFIALTVAILDYVSSEIRARFV